MIKLRQVEATLKDLLYRKVRLAYKGLGGIPYARFGLINGQLHVRMFGAGSKGAKPLLITEQQARLLTKREFLEYLAECLVKQEPLTELGVKLYS